MAESDRSISDRKFVQELIERFFHPQSYFYHVFKIILEEERKDKKNDESTLNTISSLVEFLVASSSPTNEMRDLSQLHGFEQFYSSFETKLGEIDFSEFSREQTKQFIQQLAQDCFENWIQLISFPSAASLLKSYLTLKTKLDKLIHDSNGSDSYYDAANNSLLNSENFDQLNLVQSTELVEEVIADQKVKNAAFQQFFKTELENILSQINENSISKNGNYEEDNLLENLSGIFYNVNEIAKFHEFERIEIISKKIIEIIQAVFHHQSDFKLDIVDLILGGKEDILLCLKQDLPHKDFENILKKYDLYLEELAGFNQRDELKVDELAENFDPQFDGSQQVEYNTVLQKNFEADLNEKNMSLSSNDSSTKSFQLESNNFSFRLPDEDNEDLMNLIKEVGISMSLPGEKNIDEEEKNAGLFSPGLEMLDSAKLNGFTADNEALTKFAAEAKLFFRVILDSVSKIQNRKENGSSSLDDLELASASLKQLARKLGLEKIAFFPELIESICINASLAELKLPATVLESIVNGSRLLQNYQPSDSENENKLLAALATLKEFYTYSLQAIEQHSVV